ncbi:MAG: conjugative transfer signal peptidase TraF [Janthinobacterium lividum]
MVSRRRHRLVAAVSALGMATLATMAAASSLGFVVNVTSSFPRGLYRPTWQPARVGDLVTFCPPLRVANEAIARGYIEPGRCPAGSVPLVKRLVATAGDSYAIRPDGVWVRGRRIANSTPIARDARGLSLPMRREAGVLRQGTILLMSDYSPVSFDGRYFGPTEQSGIRNAVRPLLLWDHGNQAKP